MSDNQPNVRQQVVEGAKILRACRSLADRLLMQGIAVELNEQEQSQLLSFERLMQSDFSEADWSYLRVVSGVNLRGVAALTSCLNRFRAGDEKKIYGQL